MSRGWFAPYAAPSYKLIAVKLFICSRRMHNDIPVWWGCAFLCSCDKHAVATRDNDTTMYLQYNILPSIYDLENKPRRVLDIVNPVGLWP